MRSRIVRHFPLAVHLVLKHSSTFSSFLRMIEPLSAQSGRSKLVIYHFAPIFPLFVFCFNHTLTGFTRKKKKKKISLLRHLSPFLFIPFFSYDDALTPFSSFCNSISITHPSSLSPHSRFVSPRQSRSGTINESSMDIISG